MIEILSTWIAHHGVLSVFGALGLGIVTAMAPCSLLTLPLLVAAALALDDAKTPAQRRRFALWFSLLFVAGLVISFSILLLVVAKVGLLLSVAPAWAYLLAGIASVAVALYAAGWIGGIDKDRIARRLIGLKLFGALLLGMVFGIVSTPCASAPLVAIITVAESSGWLFGYLLVLSFAIGHAALLLVAGISVSFAQNLSSSPWAAKISDAVQKVSILFLFGAGIYFFYLAAQRSFMSW